MWAHDRQVFLVEDDGYAFTAVDTATTYTLRRRRIADIELRTQAGETTTGTLSWPRRRFLDASGNVLAARKGDIVLSPAGAPIAAIYSVANQRPDLKTGDHTVVISVPSPIPMPLGLLILGYGLRLRPYIEVPLAGGGG